MPDRPLWLLDVDGVLNVLRAPDDREGYEQTRLDRCTVVWRPAAVERIARIHESGLAEVGWLMTWCEAAELLAGPLGLPAGLTVYGSADRVAHADGWWKSVTARRVSHGRPLIWTDDDLEDAEGNGEVGWLRGRQWPTLAISPDYRVGLTDDFLDRIEAFARRCLGTVPG